MRPEASIVKTQGPLSAKAKAFAMLYAGFGDGIDVAISVGYSKNRNSTSVTVTRLLKDPRIQEIIAQKQAAAAKESGKIIGRRIAKADITERLLRLADMPPKDTNGNISGQVNACKAVAEIEGFIIKKTEDLTKQLENKSEADKEFFALNGYWPSTENVDTSESGTHGSESSGAAGSKPN